MVRRLIATALFWCSAALSVMPLHAREMAGVSMADMAVVEGRELWLNGMGVSKKLFFKVYAVGLYLETPTRDAQTAIMADEGKRIIMVMLRDVSRKDFVDAVETGILRNSGPQMPTLRARLERLKQALPPLTKGNVLDFTYLPEAGTLMRAQGKELTIPGKDFSDALFSVWLGAKPANGALKRELLGAITVPGNLSPAEPVP
jgi:hypothetical protein